MSDDKVNIIYEINRLNLELKKKLEVISKWRVECAQVELEFLKLYTPECVEILESLKEMTDINIDSSLITVDNSHADIYNNQFQ